MKINVNNDDGTMYGVFQTDENTYTFKTEAKTYKFSLSEFKGNFDFSIFTEE